MISWGHSAWHMSAIMKVLVQYPWVLNMTFLKLRMGGGELVAELGPEPEWMKKWPQLPVIWGFISTLEMNEREVC